mmetsp:Transcript_77153/g.198697  ORF Transcript_77153/g.198697 Transcript_77153/m.198697 type:complete len:267 (+) Transcript_77153:269-1069(+)
MEAASARLASESVPKASSMAFCPARLGLSPQEGAEALRSGREAAISSCEVRQSSPRCESSSFCHTSGLESAAREKRTSTKVIAFAATSADGSSSSTGAPSSSSESVRSAGEGGPTLALVSSFQKARRPRRRARAKPAAQLREESRMETASMTCRACLGLVSMTAMVNSQVSSTLLSCGSATSSRSVGSFLRSVRPQRRLFQILTKSCRNTLSTRTASPTLGRASRSRLVRSLPPPPPPLGPDTGMASHPVATHFVGSPRALFRPVP